MNRLAVEAITTRLEAIAIRLEAYKLCLLGVFNLMKSLPSTSHLAKGSLLGTW